jgi:phenylalanine-4-hydroxylase
MSNKKLSYAAKPLEADDSVHYTDEENQVWHELITRQTPLLQERACHEFLQGLTILDLPTDRIPQCSEISKKLYQETGWTLEPVPALIPFERFFHLLSEHKFPAATFIRRREDLDYLQEPDMFHEVFGHCPLLTNKAYADFTHTYGKLGLKANEQERILLARLYWFTIEFGLINTHAGPRIYGGGILSSLGETPYSLESNRPLRKPFNLIDVLRTPYRIDIMQPVYYVIDHFDVLFHLIDMDLFGLIHEAERLGMYEPLYTEE